MSTAHRSADSTLEPCRRPAGTAPWRDQTTKHRPREGSRHDHDHRPQPPHPPGLQTHPGLPAPTTTPFRTREGYRAASGTDFQIDQVTMVGNTGTYLDSPFHRFADGGDLASVPLTPSPTCPPSSSTYADTAR